MDVGLLFDLDGTLLDTLEDLLDATNHTLKVLGYPARNLEELRRFVGNGAANQLRLALPENVDDSVLKQALEIYKPYYTNHCQIKTRPYAGIVQALEELQKRYPIAIVSNKPDSAVKELCRVYFPGIYALGESVGCPRKPAADMVWKAMETIGVQRCIYIGDSEVDVLTAANAGVPCLSVLWGFRDKEDIQAVGGMHFCEETGRLQAAIEELIYGQ
ncbi:MAG: HAD-IA family hydrolase [Oscillospiraceae bacterium]|nr:HAD-IA family hydrolase [Oscillospiraceae bacterium]